MLRKLIDKNSRSTDEYGTKLKILPKPTFLSNLIAFFPVKPTFAWKINTIAYSVSFGSREWMKRDRRDKCSNKSFLVIFFVTPPWVSYHWFFLTYAISPMFQSISSSLSRTLQNWCFFPFLSPSHTVIFFSFFIFLCINLMIPLVLFRDLEFHQLDIYEVILKLTASCKNDS